MVLLYLKFLYMSLVFLWIDVFQYRELNSDSRGVELSMIFALSIEFPYPLSD